MGLAVTSANVTSVVNAAEDVHAPAANTAAVVLYAADTNTTHLIGGIAWSYGVSAPTGGNIKIEDGANTILSLDITASGPNSIQFIRAVRGTKGNLLRVTLAAGGGTSVAKVTVLGHWAETSY